MVLVSCLLFSMQVVVHHNQEEKELEVQYFYRMRHLREALHQELEEELEELHLHQELEEELEEMHLHSRTCRQEQEERGLGFNQQSEQLCVQVATWVVVIVIVLSVTVVGIRCSRRRHCHRRALL